MYLKRNIVSSQLAFLCVEEKALHVGQSLASSSRVAGVHRCIRSSNYDETISVSFIFPSLVKCRGYYSLLLQAFCLNCFEDYLWEKDNCVLTADREGNAGAERLAGEVLRLYASARRTYCWPL